MVAEIANTTCQILRGTDVDEFGDVEDATTVIMTGVPACLLERTRTVFDPATQAPRTVRSAECRLPSWTGVLGTDQVIDEATGLKYAIEGVDMPGSVTGAPVDVLVTLRRISSTGT